MIGVGYQITVVEADCAWESDTVEEVPEQYSEEEIAEALAAKTLTDGQAWYLHTQGMSWQIIV
jgi:hypothetical protein